MSFSRNSFLTYGSQAFCPPRILYTVRPRRASTGTRDKAVDQFSSDQMAYRVACACGEQRMRLVGQIGQAVCRVVLHRVAAVVVFVGAMDATHQALCRCSEVVEGVGSLDRSSVR